MMKRFLIASLAVAMFGNATAGLPVPPAPDLAARAYLLVDFQSGSALAAKDPDSRVEPASLTKLMTAYLTFKAIKTNRIHLDQSFTVSERGWKTEGSRMFLDPKKPARVDELIRGMIVQSGNDACVTLAEAIAGSEDVFAAMMNQEAQRLGMKSTHYMNATGLPNPQHYTTARDLSILATAIIRDFPEFFPIYSMKEYRYNNITQPNRNLLLFRDAEVDGMKTGHTDSAGFCLIATKRHDGRRVLSVVLGTQSDNVRANESAKLLGYGLQFFDTPKVLSAHQVLAQPHVYKGETDSVKLGVETDQFVSVPKGQGTDLQKQLILPPTIIAPITAGQILGSIKLIQGGQVVGELPLKALETVPQAGFLGRMMDSMKLWFKH